METLMSKTKFRRSTEALFSTVGEDLVALNIPTGRCYGMQEVSVVVWNLIEHATELDEICAGVMELYDVEPEICRAEVGKLIEQLQAEGMVEAIED